MCGGCGGRTRTTTSSALTGGSLGACFSTVMDVTSLETLTVNVGGRGANAHDFSTGQRSVAGGANGGGAFIFIRMS